MGVHRAFSDPSSPEDIAENLLNRAAAEAARYAQARAELEDMTVTTTSSDGSVSVTVRATGAIEGIDIRDDAMVWGARQVGAAVMATVQRARAEASTLVADRIQGAVGSRMDVVGMVRDRIPEEVRAQMDQDAQRQDKPRQGWGGYEG